MLGNLLQNEVKFNFQVRFDLEGQGQLPPPPKKKNKKKIKKKMK